MKRRNFPRRKQKRQETAQRRQNKRDARSNARQLALLDEKLGKNKGATKERIRLAQEVAQKDCET